MSWAMISRTPPARTERSVSHFSGLELTGAAATALLLSSISPAIAGTRSLAQSRERRQRRQADVGRYRPGLNVADAEATATEIAKHDSLRQTRYREIGSMQTVLQHKGLHEMAVLHGYRFGR